MGSGQADRAAGFRSSGGPGLLSPEDLKLLDLAWHYLLTASPPPSASASALQQFHALSPWLIVQAIMRVSKLRFSQ